MNGREKVNWSDNDSSIIVKNLIKQKIQWSNLSQKVNQNKFIIETRKKEKGFTGIGEKNYITRSEKVIKLKNQIIVEALGLICFIFSLISFFFVDEAFPGNEESLKVTVEAIAMVLDIKSLLKSAILSTNS